MFHTSRAIAPVAVLAGVLAAQEPDLAAAERELHQMFERPAGERIGEAHKQALADFVARHRDVDLGPRCTSTWSGTTTAPSPSSTASSRATGQSNTPSMP